MLIRACRFLLAVSIGLPLAACEEISESRTLRFSHPFTETDPRHRLAEFIADELAERTGGEITVRIFPNQQLFKAKQQYEGLRTNRIDFAIYPMPWLSGRVPAANIGALPGVIDSPREGLKWRDCAIWNLLAERVREADVRMASILWVPATYASREAVPRTPDDLSGLAVRGMGTPLERLLVARGAAIRSMPAADTYFALQTGSLDILFSTVTSFAGYSMYEVLKEIVVGRSFVAGGHFLLTSRALERKLGQEEQQILEKVLIDAESFFVQLVEDEMQQTAEEFSRHGVRLVRLSDREFEAWVRAARQQSWSYFTDSVPGGAEILRAAESC